MLLPESSQPKYCFYGCCAAVPKSGVFLSPKMGPLPWILIDFLPQSIQRAQMGRHLLGTFSGPQRIAYCDPKKRVHCISGARLHVKLVRYAGLACRANQPNPCTSASAFMPAAMACAHASRTLLHVQLKSHSIAHVILPDRSARTWLGRIISSPEYHTASRLCSSTWTKPVCRMPSFSQEAILQAMAECGSR